MFTGITGCADPNVKVVVDLVVTPVKNGDEIESALARSLRVRTFRQARS